MSDRFLVRRPISGVSPSLQPVRTRLFREPRLAEMARDQLWLGFAKSREPRLDRCGDLGVQLLPAPLQQAFVRGVTHQRVFEDVSGGRRNALAKDELSREQTIKGRCEFRLRHRYDRREQFMIELTPDTGADLSDLLHGSQAI